MSKKLIKQAFERVVYTDKEIDDLKKCAQDPVYMMENFMKVLHPVKGEVNFKLYEYQKRMVNAYQNHTRTVSLTGRQLGKSSTYNTIIKTDESQIKIGELIPKNTKERLICWLERIILRLSL